MEKEKIITRLDSFWDIDEGFFFKIREGRFLLVEAEEVMKFLKKIDFDNHEYIDKEIVTMLWYIPTFLEYNSHYFVDNKDFESTKNKLTNEISRILGIP